MFLYRIFDIIIIHRPPPLPYPPPRPQLALEKRCGETDAMAKTFSIAIFINYSPVTPFAPLPSAASCPAATPCAATPCADPLRHCMASIIDDGLNKMLRCMLWISGLDGLCV